MLIYIPISLAEHGVVVEYFKDIPGLEVDKLTSSPKYPNAPDEVQKIQVFETPQDIGNQYGARLRTYFMVRWSLRQSMRNKTIERFPRPQWKFNIAKLQVLDDF